jgi:acyl carrier protein
MAAQEQTIEKRVVQLVAKVFGKEENEVTRDTRLLEDLFAKSIDIIELTAVLENEFDIEISGTDSRRALTVGQFADLIENILKK